VDNGGVAMNNQKQSSQSFSEESQDQALSTDYVTLFRMIIDGLEVPAIVDYRWDDDKDPMRDICSVIRFAAYDIRIGVRGMSYGGVYKFHEEIGAEIELFVSQCKRLNLEFFDFTSGKNTPPAANKQASPPQPSKNGGVKVVISKEVNGLVFNSDDLVRWEKETNSRLFLYHKTNNSDGAAYIKVPGGASNLDIRRSNDRTIKAHAPREDDFEDSRILLTEDHGDTIRYEDMFSDKVFSTIFRCRDIPRNTPALIKVAEAHIRDNPKSQWKILDIPGDVDFIICSNEIGEEWVAEKHRTWS